MHVLVLVGVDVADDITNDDEDLPGCDDSDARGKNAEKSEYGSQKDEVDAATKGTIISTR